MLFQMLTFLLILVGGVCVAVAAKKYYDLIKYSEEESYESSGTPRYRYAILIILCLFVLGFAVGAADVFLREVEPIYLFIGCMFFFGGVYILAMMNILTDMTKSLRRKTLEIMRAFVTSIEMKDVYTQGHSWHVYHIVSLFYDQLPHSLRQSINKPKLLDAALLHDIGKIGISDGVLNKKEKLTDGEWDIIKTHPVIGHKMLSNTCFEEISEWVLYHHERIDGKGYIGLRGEQIPVESRIIAIADTYSAISTDRVYRQKADYDTCIAILAEVAGTQLDEELLEYFCKIPPEKLMESFRRSEHAWDY